MSLVALDEVEVGIGKFQFGLAIALIAGHGNPDDPSPMLGQPLRLRALHLDADHGLRHILGIDFCQSGPAGGYGPSTSSLPSVWLNSMKAARQSRGCNCTP